MKPINNRMFARNKTEGIVTNIPIWPWIIALLAVIFLAVFAYRHGQGNRPPTGQTPLMRLGPRDCLTLEQSCEGVFASGAPGSGKSSTLRRLMRALMSRGCGMCILTSKPDDIDDVLILAHEAGRLQDVRRFAPDEPWKFDLLDYSLKQPGGAVVAYQFLQDMVDFSNRTNVTQSNDPFFPLMAARGMQMGMIPIWHVHGKCTFADLYRYMTTMQQAITKNEGFCWDVLQSAVVKEVTPDVTMAADFVLSEVSAMDPRTWGSVMGNIQVILSRFMQGSVRDLIASGISNCTPDDILNDRAIVVVDLPVNSYRESGQFVQMGWKLAFTRAALRRKVDKDTIPVCLWVDEAQNHALPLVDSLTAAVSRSQRLVNVSITQNLPLIVSLMKKREDAIAWISNHRNAFLFANNCPETNSHWSKVIGQEKQLMMSGGGSPRTYDPVADVLGEDQGGFQAREEWQPQVRPEFFASGRLRTGGARFGGWVDCFAFFGGKKFSNGKSWQKFSFQQGG